MAEIKKADKSYNCGVCESFEKGCAEITTFSDRTFIICANCLARAAYVADDTPFDEIFEQLEFDESYKIVGIIKRKQDD